jgi:hypothetical protein
VEGLPGRVSAGDGEEVAALIQDEGVQSIPSSSN